MEEATKLFAQIQVAYDVLSDPQERAWYDSHKEQILREPKDEEKLNQNGKNDGSLIYFTRGHSEDDLMKYFSSDCYQGYSDHPQSFFSVYGEIFSILGKEELNSADTDLDAGKLTSDDRYFYAELNHFGTSSVSFVHFTDNIDLKQFYSHWLNFVTVKSFRWLDKWRLSEAPNRFVKRQMEKENRAARETGRRAFNEAVRSLAAFVRKRDPRHRAYQAQLQQEKLDKQEQLKSMEASRKAAARAIIEENGNAEWMNIHIPGLAELEEQWRMEEDVEQEVWECVACDKSFRSERAFKNHEASVKHKKAVRVLRKTLLAEERNGLSVHADSDDFYDAHDHVSTPNNSDSQEEPSIVVDHENGSNQQDALLNGGIILNEKKKKQKKLKGKKAARFGFEEPDDSHVTEIIDDMDPLRSTKAPSSSITTPLDSSDDDWSKTNSKKGKRGLNRRKVKSNKASTITIAEHDTFSTGAALNEEETDDSERQDNTGRHEMRHHNKSALINDIDLAQVSCI